MARLAYVPIICISLYGCTWSDLALIHPTAGAKTVVVQAEINQAYTLGENRGFSIAVSRTYSLDTIQHAQLALDSEIIRSASEGQQLTTGRVAMVLRGEGISESDANSTVQELNSISQRPTLLISEYAALEQRRIVQSYMQGLFDGLDLGSKGLE